MAVTHIFFGGIGTLVETSELQLEAFNRAFDENNIDYKWNRDSYIRSLSSSGGQQRLKMIKLQDGSKLQDQQVSQVHADKTRIYNQLMREQGLELRVGASELFNSARHQGVKLVWATTTSQNNIDAILDATASNLKKDMFLQITNEALITKQKPDPEVYIKLLSSLNLDSDHVLAIEDSACGVASANGAGLLTLAFPGEMTSQTEFSGSYENIASLANAVSYLD
ncbi:MAG: HAD superfamily hydrolase (TIGR01509 family) [Polaribacter sp.]|jgi:HAD superfamily hydrolase (TIGR01509 family)